MENGRALGYNFFEDIGLISISGEPTIRTIGCCCRFYNVIWNGKHDLVALVESLGYNVIEVVNVSHAALPSSALNVLQ